MSTMAAWLPILVLALALAVWAYCLIDFSRTDERDMRTFPRNVWLLILILGNVLGGMAWLLAGRRRSPGTGA